MKAVDLMPVIRCVRDCGVIRARGRAQSRFERGVLAGYLTMQSAGQWGARDYRLSPKGRQVVAIWRAMER